MESDAATAMDYVFLAVTAAVAYHGLTWRNEEGGSDFVRLLFGSIALLFFFRVLLADVMVVSGRKRERLVVVIERSRVLAVLEEPLAFEAGGVTGRAAGDEGLVEKESADEDAHEDRCPYQQPVDALVTHRKVRGSAG